MIEYECQDCQHWIRHNPMSKRGTCVFDETGEISEEEIEGDWTREDDSCEFFESHRRFAKKPPKVDPSALEPEEFEAIQP